VPVGAGVGVFVQALGVTVDVGHGVCLSPPHHGVLVGVGVAVGVAVDAGSSPTLLCSVAPTHAADGVVQDKILTTFASNTAAFCIVRLSSPSAAALSFNTARGAETPAPKGSVNVPAGLMLDM